MRRRVILVVAPLGLAAAVIGLVWWSPSSSPADTVVRAREAFGNRPVVHVIARTGIPPGAVPTRPVVDDTQLEIWLDRSRHVVHVVERRDGKLVTDVLGTRFRPTIDPALTDFVSTFETDLTSGHLKAAGSGAIQGRRVLWLQSALMLVAVDPASYQALWVRQIAAGKPAGRLTQIVVAETLPAGVGDFQTRRKKPRHL